MEAQNNNDGDANVPSHSYGTVVVTPILMLSLSFIAVGLRCWVKGRLLNRFTPDDWLLLLSFVLYATICTLAITSASYGFGVHSASLSEHNLRIVYHLWFFEEIMYLLATIVLKLSISILLVRLVVERTNRLLIWGTAAFYTITGILFIFGIIFRCHPIPTFWTENDTCSRCIPNHVFAIFAYLNATISLVTDFIFIFVPTLTVWRYDLERRVKISVSIVLCFGFFASSVNIVRYPYIGNLASPGDNSFDYFVIGIVSILEIGFGIIAIALAACKPLARTIILPCLQGAKSKLKTRSGDPTHSKMTQNKSRATIDLEKGTPRITGTIRSQGGLKDDVKTWEDTCAPARERGTPMQASLEIELDKGVIERAK